MEICGIARTDRLTKQLVKRLRPGEIAVIDHQDLDELAGQALAAARVKAVVNTARTISGSYPNLGPQVLLKAGIPLVDQAGAQLFELVHDGDELRITDHGEIILRGTKVAEGQIMNLREVTKLMAQTREKLGIILESFVQNTLEYAQHERGLILGEVKPPAVNTVFKGRHTLIVVRGKDHREDLRTIKSYITEVKPVLVGVDGGADVLREFGYQPDLIVGDMDSVSDRALAECPELVVHAYPDGRAPGLTRTAGLGLQAKVFPAPGTSEDIAMLLAYEMKTELIVAVGTHSNLIDFLEKGRKGMASTFLVRLKVGTILVDAKGVSQLYGQKLKLRHLAQMILAAMVPLSFVVWIAPSTRHLLRLAFLQVRVLLGI